MSDLKKLAAEVREVFGDRLRGTMGGGMLTISRLLDAIDAHDCGADLATLTASLDACEARALKLLAEGERVTADEEWEIVRLRKQIDETTDALKWERVAFEDRRVRLEAAEQAVTKLSADIDRLCDEKAALRARVDELEAFVPVRGRMFEAVKEMFRSLQAFEAALAADPRSQEQESAQEKRLTQLAKQILNDCDPKYAMYGPGRRLARLVLGQSELLEKDDL